MNHINDENDCFCDVDQVDIDFTCDELLLGTDNPSNDTSMTVIQLHGANCKTEIEGETNIVFEKMSLLEQKRLQWAAEKEQLSEWNPWGRPGCGAPAVSYTSTTVTQSTQKQQLTVWHRKPEDFSTAVSAPLHVSCPPTEFPGCAERSRLPPLSSSSSVSPSGQRSLPSTIVSTLGLNNNPFIYTYAYDLWKEEAKKQWLQELDKQREEQRLRKQNMPELSSSKSCLNNFNAGSLITPLIAENNFSALPSVNNNCSHPSPISIADGANSLSSWPNKTFLRGANAPVDPNIQNDLAIKRARALQQQEAIQIQIEERRRLKEAEKEEEKRRELQEELRLAKDTCGSISQIKINQQPTQVKEIENKEQLSKVANFEQKPFSLPDVVDGTFKDPSKTSAEPSNGSSSNGPKNEAIHNEQNRLNETQISYVVNRVLTPTKYRGNAIISRDFATQTDFENDGGFPFKKDASTSTKGTEEKQNIKNEVRAKNNQRANSKGKAKNSKDASLNRKVDSRGSDQKKLSTKSSKRSESGLESDDRDLQTPIVRRRESQTKAISNSRRTPANVNGSGGGRSPTSAHRSRSRSSAEYQKKIIADESQTHRSSQRRSLSPLVSYSRLTATGSSSTCDEDLLGCSRPTRRKRRQWESPVRDEVPHFYTDSPQLPDGRLLRRNKYLSEGSKLSHNLKEYPNVNDRGKHFSNQEAIDECSRVNNLNFDSETADRESALKSKPFRSDSPPVPALRRLHLQQNSMVEETDNLRSHCDRNENNSEQIKQNVNLEKLSSSTNLPTDLKQSLEYGDIQTNSCNETTSNQNFMQASDIERDEILRKLTIIRHNLSLKQQEVNQISSGRVNFDANR